MQKVEEFSSPKTVETWYFGQEFFTSAEPAKRQMVFKILLEKQQTARVD